MSDLGYIGEQGYEYNATENPSKDMDMRQFVLLALVIVSSQALSACQSSNKKIESFYGKPIQYMMLRRGEPDRIIDMPHKARAFQWFQTPENVASSVIGDRVIGVNMKDECTYTVFAEWDELQDAFIIYDHEDVKFGC